MWPHCQNLSAIFEPHKETKTLICGTNVVDNHQPEVEVGGSKELILNPVTICRNEREKCHIEPSVNSVRVSIMIKQSDEIEEVSKDPLKKRSKAVDILKMAKDSEMYAQPMLGQSLSQMAEWFMPSVEHVFSYTLSSPSGSMPQVHAIFDAAR